MRRFLDGCALAGLHSVAVIFLVLAGPADMGAQQPGGAAARSARDAAPIDLSRLPKPAGVYDMIYNPPQTALLRTAAALGIPRANGLSMLVHQGARALSIWSDADVPVGAMSLAARNALRA